ncbi:hypothetical protein HanRHA438_Chr09g0380621 [Helianthus annuus]|nr:hypothetical protein HanRHA438_Chr09g0380621 [Helianthus annuus]
MTSQIGRRFDYRSHDIISTPNNCQKKLEFFFKMAANVVVLVAFRNQIIYDNKLIFVIKLYMIIN